MFLEYRATVTFVMTGMSFMQNIVVGITTNLEEHLLQLFGCWRVDLQPLF